MKVLVLSASAIDPIVDMKDALGLAQKAYELQGKISQGGLAGHFSPLVAYIVNGPKESPGFFDFRSGYVRDIPIIISTMGYGFPENKVRHNLPGVFALSVISDINTGAPLAIMDADLLASMRTGAASAIASKYLAKENSRSIAFIGAGHLARNMLDAHIAFGFPIDRIKVWSRTRSVREEFAKKASEKYHILSISTETPREATANADIICCCSPSTEPRVNLDDLGPGVHINAFGADSPGKQELALEVLTKCKIVVDSLEQCSIGGEIHKALQAGSISSRDIYAEIGEIVLGEKQGRTNPKEMTLMDATGLAIQDLVIFYHVYKLALERGVGDWIEL